jgi:osmotically-inducible protein OsmY
MIRSVFIALIGVTLATLLAGCAAVVVGGAATAGAAHDRRSIGTVIDDQTLEVAAIDRIYTERDRFDGTRIIAVANNGLVLLIGEVFDEALKLRAGERVAELRGARRVVNELTVVESPGFWRNSADVALTGRVKTALFGIKLPDFDPLRVNVTSRRGEVYLMGLVTNEEAEAVTQRVRRMRGVKRVIKVFEYVD